MTSFLGANTAWALVAIVAIPLAVVLAAELDERVRQRESPLRPVVKTLRNYALPAFAVWTLLAAVLGFDAESFVVRAAASVLVISIGVAVMGAIGVGVAEVTNRRRARSEEAPPQLILAMPRLIAVLVVGWVLVGRVWSVDLSGLLTALGVTSLVVSFALQDTLSGLASGLLLLGDQPFRTGDWIEAGDHRGIVVDINWRTTRIRDRNGDTIVVPNSELAGAAILNHTTPDRLHRVVVPVQVAYVNPPTLAKAMLLDAARETPGVLADPAPSVRVVQIDDPLMGYEVRMWIDDYAIAPRVTSDFGSLVWYQSHRHDVPLPSPAQDLYLYDGVAASAAGRPSTSEIRRLLQQAAVLSTLPDEDLDRLADAGRHDRYAVGETLIDTRRTTQDLLVVVEGRAELVAQAPDGSEAVISEIAGPRTAGLIERPRGGGNVLLRATEDCEVIVVDAATASEVASRNPELASALNRMADVRRGRVERWIEREAPQP